MATAKLKVFRVSPKIQRAGAEQPPRLIKATRLKEVEAFLIAELNIHEASAEDAHECARQEVPIESAIAAGTTTGA